MWPIGESSCNLKNLAMVGSYVKNLFIGVRMNEKKLERQRVQI